jgi:hypothetical protein
MPDPVRPGNGQGHGQVDDLGGDLEDGGLRDNMDGPEANPVVNPVISPVVDPPENPTIYPVAIPIISPIGSNSNINNKQQPTHPLDPPSSPSNAGYQADEDYYMLSATSDDDDDVYILRNEGVFDNVLDIQPNTQEIAEDAVAVRPPGVRYDGRRYIKYIPAWTDPNLSVTGPTPYPYRRPALLPEDRQGLETGDPSNYAL